MSNKKKSSQQPFNLELAFATADQYLITADHLKKKAPKKSQNEKKASDYVTISNLAFAIEIYLKAISYMMEGYTKGGHDLAALWKQLPKELRNYLSHNFEKLFDSENEQWTIDLAFGRVTSESKISSFKTHELSAEGIIKTHRLAFDIGRYAYEHPHGNETRSILYNINGLVTLSWLLRGTAHHFLKILIRESKEGKLDGTREVNFDFPKTIIKFPS